MHVTTTYLQRRRSRHAKSATAVQYLVKIDVSGKDFSFVCRAGLYENIDDDQAERRQIKL